MELSPETRYLAGRIPGARFVELPDVGHLALGGAADRIGVETSRFLTDVWESGSWNETEPDRMLATVLFTDIVDATAKALELGDRAWRELLERHHSIVRRELTRFRGREIDTAGDGFFAAFDGPARAIRCACAVVDGVRELGIDVRAGLHTGECEVADGKVAGIAVHTGARVAANGRGGRRLEHRQGPCRRLRNRVRGSRLPRAQGHPRRVAFVQRRARI